MTQRLISKASKPKLKLYYVWYSQKFVKKIYSLFIILYKNGR